MPSHLKEVALEMALFCLNIIIRLTQGALVVSCVTFAVLLFIMPWMAIFPALAIVWCIVWLLIIKWICRKYFSCKAWSSTNEHT